MIPQARAVFISGLHGRSLRGRHGPDQGRRPRLLRACCSMCLTRQKRAFPFTGRTIFEASAAPSVRETFEGEQPGNNRYLERLAERKQKAAATLRPDRLAVRLHHTDSTAQSALCGCIGCADTRSGGRR